MKAILIFLTIFIVISISILVNAGEVELSEKAAVQVRQHTREMIQSGIHETDAEALTQKMIQKRFEAQEIIRAQKVVIGVKRAGLPTEPVLLKAHEGMAKKVPPSKIIAAMESVRQRLSRSKKTAAGLCGEKRNCDRIGKAVAEGLAAGLDDSAVDRMANRLRLRRNARGAGDSDDVTAEAFLTARDMARLGVSPKTSADVVCGALSAGYGSQEMRQLRSEIKRQSHRSDPEALGRRFQNRFQKRKAPDSAPSSGSGGQERHQRRHGGNDADTSGGSDNSGGNNNGKKGDGNGGKGGRNR